MEVIVNVSDSRFSINGIQYFKNFMPVVRGTMIEIVNQYDSGLRLMELTIYTEVEVDGTVYGNVASAQSALLPVLFTRESLGGLADGSASWGSITGDIANQTDLMLLFSGEGSVENYYDDVSAMLVDQANQTDGLIQYVHDATDDPNVDSGFAWYQYNGTTNVVLTDYTLLGKFSLAFKPLDRFIWNEAEFCYIVKTGTNADITVLETDDLVYEKDVTHNGITLTLRGWTFNGGDSSLQSNYTKSKNYA